MIERDSTDGLWLERTDYSVTLTQRDDAEGRREVDLDKYDVAWLLPRLEAFLAAQEVNP